MKTLGERLCQFRKKNHIKQADLAKKMNVSQQVISNIECGRTSPNIEQLKKLGALLASLWVRNAAFPCNQATLGTFDFRLGSGMRISEHTRYTISIMF